MTRWTGLAIGAVAVALASVWLAVAVPARRAAAPPPSSGGPRASTQAVTGSLDDVMMDLQLIPVDAQTPKAFVLESLDGRRVALADLAGRPALLYFWASW